MSLPGLSYMDLSWTSGKLKTFAGILEDLDPSAIFYASA